MSLTYRSVKLVRGGVETSLNAAPYSLVEGEWSDDGTSLELTVLVQAATWAEVERHVAALQRTLTLAAYYAQVGSGDPLYVHSKRCDALSTVAEIGATWKRKQVVGGSARVSKWMASPTDVSAWVSVAMTVKPTWLRAAAIPVIESTWTGMSVYPGGGLTATAATTPASCWVRRLGWTSSTGLTGRWFWRYASTRTDVLNLLKLSANFALYWSGSANRFYFADNSGTTRGQTGAQPFTDGEEIEIVFSVTATSAVLYINGVSGFSYGGTVTWPASPARYRIWEPTGTATGTVLSVQIWPTSMTGAQIEELRNWGRPAPELPFAITPTDGATPTPCENTSAMWKLYGTPGSATARLRPIVAGYTANYDALAVGVRAGGTPRPATGGPVVKFECESGTLGSNTASTADANASAGNVARFTPANTSWAVRTTIAVGADAVHVDPYQGRWRLYLQGVDNAASVQVNSIRWRLKIAGLAVGDYSDTYSLPSVSTRCLIDIGELTLPPTAWPEGSASSAGTEYSGTYLAIEIEAMNATGSGGGTLDLDALYLAPADLEALATATDWVVADQVLYLDFASEPPAPCILYDTWSTLEWGGRVTWEGSALELPPTTDPDDGALLWLYAYRSTSYEARPKDTLFAWLQLLPAWED